MIKGFQEWINENEEPSGQLSPGDLQNLLDLGLIDPLEFTRGAKKIDPTGWVDSLLQDLESRHLAEPDIWGKPVVYKTPYNTIEFTLSSDLVNMAQNHYNNYEYERQYDDPVTVVVYLGGDSSLELRALYANRDFEEGYEDEDDEDEDDENSYDATWSYNGPISILKVEDILEIIDGFNEEVDDDTIEDTSDWSHD
jgi:hypothetical protein